MPVQNYGVLCARPIARRLGTGERPHYRIHARTWGGDYCVAINVKGRHGLSDLYYLVESNFTHPLTTFLQTLPEGFTFLPERSAQGHGLDYIRGHLFDARLMVPLPHDVPGADNDLNEKFDAIVQRALAEEDASLFAFGSAWGPEPQRPDPYFGFLPGRGVHEVHMNQGSAAPFRRSNGVWQDGGLIFHFPAHAQWVAVFTAFQSQSWHTDDQTGERLGATIIGPALRDTPRPAVPLPRCRRGDRRRRKSAC